MFLPSSALRPAVAVLVGAALFAGCTGGNGGGSASGKRRESAGASGAAPARSAASASGGAASSLIANGPGPQAHYTVQAQPAPGTCHYRTVHGQPLQDASCTPGALNPDVIQATLKTAVCRTSGFTSTIRPPVSVTSVEKRANVRSCGYAASLHDAEYGHLISLELGGAPNDARNLWVEPPAPWPHARQRAHQPQGRRGEQAAPGAVRGAGHPRPGPAGHRHRLDHRPGHPPPHMNGTPAQGRRAIQVVRVVRTLRSSRCAMLCGCVSSSRASKAFRSSASRVSVAWDRSLARQIWA